MIYRVTVVVGYGRSTIVVDPSSVTLNEAGDWANTLPVLDLFLGFSHILEPMCRDAKMMTYLNINRYIVSAYLYSIFISCMF